MVVIVFGSYDQPQIFCLAQFFVYGAVYLPLHFDCFYLTIHPTQIIKQAVQSSKHGVNTAHSIFVFNELLLVLDNQFFFIVVLLIEFANALTSWAYFLIVFSLFSSKRSWLIKLEMISLVNNRLFIVVTSEKILFLFYPKSTKIYYQPNFKLNIFKSRMYKITAPMSDTFNVVFDSGAFSVI